MTGWTNYLNFNLLKLNSVQLDLFTVKLWMQYTQILLIFKKLNGKLNLIMNGLKITKSYKVHSIKMVSKKLLRLINLSKLNIKITLNFVNGSNVTLILSIQENHMMLKIVEKIKIYSTSWEEIKLLLSLNKRSKRHLLLLLDDRVNY